MAVREGTAVCRPGRYLSKVAFGVEEFFLTPFPPRVTARPVSRERWNRPFHNASFFGSDERARPDHLAIKSQVSTRGQRKPTGQEWLWWALTSRMPVPLSYFPRLALAIWALTWYALCP